MSAWRVVIRVWLGIDASGFFDRLSALDWYAATHKDWLDDIPVGAGDRVLEVGCGPGHLAVQLAEAGAQVLAIDRSPKMVARASKRVPAPCEVRIGDAADLPDKDYDVVLAASLVNIVPDSQKLIDSLAARVTPGGKLSVVFPTPALKTSADDIAKARNLRGFSAAAIATWGRLAPKLEAEFVQELFRNVGLEDIRTTLLLDGSVASVTGTKAQ